MDVPFFRRAAAKYMTAYTSNKKKSIEEHRKTTMEAFNKKGKASAEGASHPVDSRPTEAKEWFRPAGWNHCNLAQGD